MAVVTGQQAVLFGGPLYVLYKALAAMRRSRGCWSSRGAPVVPVFWVASDDHDFAEVRSARVLDESGQIRTLRYAPRASRSASPRRASCSTSGSRRCSRRPRRACRRAVKAAVHRLRRRFQSLLRQRVAETVADGRDVDDEIRHLIQALSA